MPKHLSRNLPDVPYWAWIGVPFVAWLLAWAVQIHLPIFDYAPGVALVFFPAGVRTLSVLVFGWRGALGVAIGSLSTYLWFFDGSLSTENLFHGIVLATISGFSALLVFRLVQYWQCIPSDLSTLRLKHILFIVISQGLLSASLHQFTFHIFPLSPFYVEQPSAVYLNNWLAMAIGDTLGSMLLLYAVAIAARWAIQRITYSEPGS